MRNKTNRRILSLVLLAGLICLGTAWAGTSNPQVESRDRLLKPELVEALLGALAYLEDTQIRNRPGRGHPFVDSTSEGDGAKNEIAFNLPFRENIPMPAIPLLKVTNKIGEWASFVHFLPKRTGLAGRDFVSVPDSNLFMTAFIGYPLFLFDDSRFPGERQFIKPIMQLALGNIQSFFRGDSYNFWSALPGKFGSATRTGPLNIPVELVKGLGSSFINPKFDKFFAWLTRGQKAPPKFWVEQCLANKDNPTGADALFNIPNDADDTCTAVAFQALCAKRYSTKFTKVEKDVLALLAHFRDLNRTKEDGRDAWKGKNTGAFMTWLKDESLPLFETPDSGVVPLAVNNVDCVVNANVAFSLSTNGMKSLPGYAECLDLIARAAEKHVWPDAGLYYPQYMIFPYTVTRAWRDGGAREGPMEKAMETLLRNLLDEQEAWGLKNPGRNGAFPGGEDRTDHLSTALGLCTLLNLGQPMAERIGQRERFDRGVKNAVTFLCKSGRERKIVYQSTRRIFPDRDLRARSWDSGLFFAASFWDLAHWRSEAFTVAMVTEALSKYALAYDLDQSAFGKRKLFLIDDSSQPWGIRIEGR